MVRPYMLIYNGFHIVPSDSSVSDQKKKTLDKIKDIPLDVLNAQHRIVSAQLRNASREEVEALRDAVRALIARHKKHA